MQQLTTNDNSRHTSHRAPQEQNTETRSLTKFLHFNCIVYVKQFIWNQLCWKYL